MKGATTSAPFSVFVTIFQSALPMKGATPKKLLKLVKQYAFQSALPMKGATHKVKPLLVVVQISIRAPNERSDVGIKLP